MITTWGWGGCGAGIITSLGWGGFPCVEYTPTLSATYLADNRAYYCVPRARTSSSDILIRTRPDDVLERPRPAITPSRFRSEIC